MRDTRVMRSLSRPLRALLVGAVAAAIALAVAPRLEGLENRTVDERYDIRGSQGPPKDVAVVGIDEDSFARLQLQWPFPRSVHARAIRNLLRAGARVVAYDVQFSEPSEPREDRALLRAAADPRVVLGTEEETPRGEPLVIGLEQLRRGGGRVGDADFPVDDDGVIREVQGRIQNLPQLAVAAAGGRADRRRQRIDFAGPAATVHTLSFADVVENRFDPRDVRGRIVFVGATTPVLQDIKETAASPLMPGVEVHANAAATVLRGYPLRDASQLVGVLLVVVGALVAPAATLPGRPNRAVVQALAAGVLGVGVLLVATQLLFNGGWVVPVVTPAVAIVLGTIGAVAFTYATEVRARRQVRAAFERFVPREVVDEILRREGGVPRIESRRIEATVMFCDLRGFTTLAEVLAAEQVIAVLNRYLDAVSGAVFDHGGTVVSYQGDGVMSVFGAPLERPDHAQRALQAARAVLEERLPAFNAWLAEQGLTDAPLDVGIGLNTGPVMSGNVGSDRRLEYAAVGDATNVAARLQALSRDVPQRLFVSATTWEALGAQTDSLRPFGEIALKGRREPVTVYAG